MDKRDRPPPLDHGMHHVPAPLAPTRIELRCRRCYDTLGFDSSFTCTGGDVNLHVLSIEPCPCIFEKNSSPAGEDRGADIAAVAESHPAPAGDDPTEASQ